MTLEIQRPDVERKPRPDGYRIIRIRQEDGSHVVTGKEPVFFGQRREQQDVVAPHVIFPTEKTISQPES